VVQSLLQAGCKSFSHLLNTIERYNSEGECDESVLCECGVRECGESGESVVRVCGECGERMEIVGVWGGARER
jgi:hypothetical protein